MMPHRISKSTRGLTWLLIAAFLLASGPAPAFAQRESAPSPAEAARARIQKARAARSASPTPSAPAAPSVTPAPVEGSYDFSEDPKPNANGEQVYNLNLKDAQMDVLLDRYSDLTGRTMIKAPGINASFTFKAQSKLTRAEMIQAMDSLLAMNNITLVPLGSRFYRVVQTDKAPSEGMEIQHEDSEGLPPESDALVSQLVALEFLDMEDAMNVIQPMLHGYGKAQRFDRINSILITETSANLRRVYEILGLVDQPVVSQIEPRIYEIQHAKAADIAARLNELISDSQSEEKEVVARVAQPVVRRRSNMIRARRPAAAETAPASAAAVEAAMAERGIITGKVKIISDERTNIIIVFSRKSNFEFFDKIVAILDRPVDPEVIVQVIALEFADAEEMAGLLNDFIGAAQSDSESAGQPASEEGTDSRAKALEDFVRARAAATDRVRQAAGDAVASKIGQLSPNTKILADQRTNALMLMGTKGDIAALQEIVKKVDIMLAQVLIEAVILEVNLNNNTAYGVSWLQKSMTAYSQSSAGANGGISIREPIASWGGNFGANNFASVAGDTVTRALGGGSGLSYFFTFANLNMDMLLDMVASSGEGRVLATPVILTTDNTEASILSGQQIPVRTSDTESGGTFNSNFEYKDVGISLVVKPRINPSRYVTLEITQTADTLGEPVDVGSSGTMTSINKREMTASVSVPSRSTIVLGGLVQTDYQALNTRVPILGSLPLIGALFRSEDKSRKRTELLVLITPYVLMTPEEARVETERLHQASNVAAEDWYRGWSDSSLAPFSPTKLREMKRAEKSGRAYNQLDTDSVPEVIPPVAVIAPEQAMPKPTPDAKNPEEFSREVERVMSGQAESRDGEAVAPTLSPAGPLPEPPEPTTTAPYTFDPAAAAVPSEGEQAPAPEAVVEPPPAKKKKPRRALWGTRVKPEKKIGLKDDNKPSMFPAPPPEESEMNGDTP
jgi:general secretion pathway protein D